MSLVKLSMTGFLDFFVHSTYFLFLKLSTQIRYKIKLAISFLKYDLLKLSDWNKQLLELANSKIYSFLTAWFFVHIESQQDKVLNFVKFDLYVIMFGNAINNFISS